MCNALLSCPLCSTPRFNDLETLRVALIKVATENLACPICEEIYMGLDKLTIHLFSHQESDFKNKREDLNLKTEDENGMNESDTNNMTSSTPEVNCNESSLSAEVREYKKRRNKIKKSPSLTKKELSDLNENSTSKCLPVFNMNTIVPFIGIPQNLSVDTIKSKTNKCSEKRGSKSNKLSEKCDICGFFFLGKNILDMHKKLIHNIHNSEIVNGISQYCCHLCSKVFKMKGSLMVHLRMVHFAVIPSVTENTEERSEEAKSPMEIVNEDAKSNKQVDGSVENKVVDGSGETNAGGKTWKCDICEKNFTTKYFLKKHKRLHTGEMPYSCTQCNKTFTFQQSYHKHLLYHNDDKPHTCSHCGRGFKELSTLHNHQRIHTGEKPFECETCGKCFRQRVSYLVHRRIHTGAMPYKCTACEKSFRYKVSQRMHKCTAQPPGTVVRQSGDLVQKLMKNHQDISSDILNEFSLSGDENSNSNSNIGFDSNKKDRIQIVNDEILDNICGQTFSDDCNINYTDKSNIQNEKNVNCIIDEIVKESISKIDFSDPKPSTSTDFHNVGDLYTIVSNQSNKTNNNVLDESLPSPSDGMKNLKLNSMSPEVTCVDNNDPVTIKAFDKNEMSYIFGITSLESDNSFVKDKDNSMYFLQDNMECQNIFTDR